ncbi:hypothetical protein BJ165DRAFT_1517236 [Panaeolus papilionaceus]|nr:hypothetical protein BJ165DRAFT_1517236 [Panaeolus papilionaceus]
MLLNRMSVRQRLNPRPQRSWSLCIRCFQASCCRRFKALDLNSKCIAVLSVSLTLDVLAGLSFYSSIGFPTRTPGTILLYTLAIIVQNLVLCEL